MSKFKKNSPGCTCCGSPSCGTICTALSDSCTGADVAGALITVKKSGVFVSDCTTTAGHVTSIVRTNPGSGYGAAPTVTLTGGGGSGATATCSVFAGQIQGFTVTNAGSGYTSNPTVTVTPTSGGVNGAGSAAIGTRCCADVFSTGTSGQYTLDIAATGYTTRTGISVGAVACSGTSNTPQVLTLTPSTATLTACVSGPCGGTTVAGDCTTYVLDGAAVLIKQSGTTVASGTSNVHGVVSFPGLTPGVYTAEASLSPRIAATSPVSVTLTACGTSVLVPTTAASGYHCFIVLDAFSHPIAFADCVLPLADTLFLTDPVYGAVTITWTASSVLSGQAAWEGTKTITVGACGGCAGSSATGLWSMAGTGGNSLASRYSTTVGTTPCPGPGPIWTGGNVSTVTGYTCPPAATLTWSKARDSNMYCGAGTIVIGVSE